MINPHQSEDFPVHPALADLVESFDHLAFAVHDLSATARFLQMLGGKFLHGADNGWGGFRWVHFAFGDFKVEVISPVAQDSFLWDFLEKRGEGIHHLTFRVSSVAEVVQRAQNTDLKVVGVRISPEPEGWSECFIHPTSAHGTVIQLAEWTDLHLPEVTLDDVLAGLVHID